MIPPVTDNSVSAGGLLSGTTATQQLSTMAPVSQPSSHMCITNAHSVTGHGTYYNQYFPQQYPYDHQYASTYGVGSPFGYYSGTSTGATGQTHHMGQNSSQPVNSYSQPFVPHTGPTSSFAPPPPPPPLPVHGVVGAVQGTLVNVAAWILNAKIPTMPIGQGQQSQLPLYDQQGNFFFIFHLFYSEGFYITFIYICILSFSTY